MYTFVQRCSIEMWYKSTYTQRECLLTCQEEEHLVSAGHCQLTNRNWLIDDQTRAAVWNKQYKEWLLICKFYIKTLINHCHVHVHVWSSRFQLTSKNEMCAVRHCVSNQHIIRCKCEEKKNEYPRSIWLPLIILIFITTAVSIENLVWEFFNHTLCLPGLQYSRYRSSHE